MAQTNSAPHGLLEQIRQEYRQQEAHLQEVRRNRETARAYLLKAMQEEAYAAEHVDLYRLQAATAERRKAQAFLDACCQEYFRILNERCRGTYEQDAGRK